VTVSNILTASNHYFVVVVIALSQLGTFVPNYHDS